ncbi:MAG: DUF4271 domain-containing protein [Schleiferiaceae bacterium]
MQGEPIHFLPWWWYVVAVGGLALIAALWSPTPQGKRRIARLGVQLWSEGLPPAVGLWLSMGTSMAAVASLYAAAGLQPAYTGLVLIAPWLVHALTGVIWNAVRVHQAYHQYRSMLMPLLVLLVVPYAWWRLTGSNPEPKISLIVLVSAFGVLYVTSVVRAASIYITRGPGPLYFRIAYLCALEAIPWLWIHNWLSASEK